MGLFNHARKGLVAGVGVVALVGAATGIAYAAATAAPTNDFANACSSKSHVLRLFDSAGHCPSGFSRIKVASAPQSIVIRSVSTTTTQHAVVVRSMRITGLCKRNGFSELVLRTTSGTSAYDVRGADYLGQGGATGFHFDFNNGSSRAQTSNGSGYISYTATTTESEIILDEGELNTNLIVTRAGRTFTIDLYMQQDANSCFVEAQIAASG